MTESWGSVAEMGVGGKKIVDQPGDLEVSIYAENWKPDYSRYRKTSNPCGTHNTKVQVWIQQMEPHWPLCGGGTG